MKLNQTVKRWLAVTIVGVMTFLSLSQLHLTKDIEVLADDTEETEDSPEKDAGVYAESELTAVLPSAFYDARNEVTSVNGQEEDDKRDTLKNNIGDVIGDSFGNVGLFLGQATEVENKWGSSVAPISIDINDANDYFASGDLVSYYNFGHAIHHLDKSSVGMNSTNMKMSNTLDTLSHSMSALTKLGVRLMQDYDPSPLLFSLYLTEENKQRTKWLDLPQHYSLSNIEGNKLVDIVQNNPTLREAWSLLRRPALGGSTTLVGSIVFVSVVLLIISGMIMTAVNGRSSGENYRKALVRIVISFVGIPLVAMFLHYGINTFVGVIEPDITQAEQQAKQGIREHLNIADWYSTGFAVPTGIELKIEDGKFKFTQDQVERINNYTYTMVTSGSTGDPDNGTPNVEDVFQRLYMTGITPNLHNPVFSEKSGWDGYSVKVVGNTIKENEEELGTFDVIAARRNYLISRNKGTTNDGITTIYADPNSIGEYASEHNFYGVSPLAAHNMMRSAFGGGKITANKSKAPLMSGVALYAVPEEAGRGLNPIVRFLATLGMVIAATKALVTIFTTGIGGIIGGTAGAAVGKTAGMGQAVGGTLALVGGVIGMGLIMDLSFILLEEMAVILYDMFVGVTGDASLIEPVREWVDDWPKILSLFKGPVIGILNKVAGAITFFVTLIVVPKFGKIPITIFGEKMAELPGLFAEKAQQMENRFTGDFRGGSARGSSVGQSITNSSNQMMDQSGNQMAGVGAATGAMLGMGASKVGETLLNKAAEMEGRGDGESMAGGGNDTDPNGGGDITAVGGNNEFSDEQVKEDVAVTENINSEDDVHSDTLSQEQKDAQEEQIKEQEKKQNAQNSDTGETLSSEQQSELQGGTKESASEKDSAKESAFDSSSEGADGANTEQGASLDENGNPILESSDDAVSMNDTDTSTGIQGSSFDDNGNPILESSDDAGSMSDTDSSTGVQGSSFDENGNPMSEGSFGAETMNSTDLSTAEQGSFGAETMNSAESSTAEQGSLGAETTNSTESSVEQGSLGAETMNSTESSANTDLSTVGQGDPMSEGSYGNESLNDSGVAGGSEISDNNQEISGNESLFEVNSGVENVNAQHQAGGEFSNVNVDDDHQELSVSDERLDSENFSNINVKDNAQGGQGSLGGQGTAGGQGSPGVVTGTSGGSVSPGVATGTTGGSVSPGVVTGTSGGSVSPAQPKGEMSATERMSQGTTSLTPKGNSVNPTNGGRQVNKATSGTTTSPGGTAVNSGGSSGDNKGMRSPKNPNVGGVTGDKGGVTRGNKTPKTGDKMAGGVSSTPNKTPSFKVTPARVLGAVGKGMESAGGPVTAERATKAAKLAGASIIGGKAQQNAHNELRKAQGDVVSNNREQTSQNSSRQQDQQGRQAQKVENDRLMQEEQARAYEDNRR